MAKGVLSSKPLKLAESPSAPGEADLIPGLPEFVPMPGGKTIEFYSSLKRGAINLLVLPCEANEFKPPVKSISLRKKGNKHGKRLVVLQGEHGRQLGLLTYLRRLRDQAPAAA